jgi:hypothetical protein
MILSHLLNCFSSVTYKILRCYFNIKKIISEIMIDFYLKNNAYNKEIY